MKYKEGIIEVLTRSANIADGITIDESSAMDNTEGWDSLTFVDVLIGLEAHFDVKFSTLESATLISVSAIDEILTKKLG